MQVGLLEGRFFKMLVRLTGAKEVLEIGMFTRTSAENGYSAVTSVQINDELAVSIFKEVIGVTSIHLTFQAVTVT
jgi:predicted O-methyltransferase YrrM